MMQHTMHLHALNYSLTLSPPKCTRKAPCRSFRPIMNLRDYMRTRVFSTPCFDGGILRSDYSRSSTLLNTKLCGPEGQHLTLLSFNSICRSCHHDPFSHSRLESRLSRAGLEMFVAIVLILIRPSVFSQGHTRDTKVHRQGTESIK
jgi:hypothetical protein